MPLLDKLSSFENEKKELLSFQPQFFGTPMEEIYSATEAKINGKRVHLLGTNNYLGLTGHPQVVGAAQHAALRYGTGAGSAPLLVGTFPITRKLESQLADLKHSQEACVFASGYQTNVGVISALAGKNDLIVVDQLGHAGGPAKRNPQVRVPAEIERRRETIVARGHDPFAVTQIERQTRAVATANDGRVDRDAAVSIRVR